MKVDYDTLEVEIRYKSSMVTVYSWSCNLGWGETVIASNGTIIDDECMGEEFCRKVEEKANESL